MGYATDQRHAFSAALLEVGPEAPTLCEGWTAYDLAAHCWVRERSAKALLGIGSKRFEHLAAAEMDATKGRMGFVELATRLAETPRTPVTLAPGGDDMVNAAEYFIHTEDVRRANGLPNRPSDPDLEDMFWARLGLIGRVFFGSSPVGVVLERAGTGQTHRVKAGAQTVTLLGTPSELLLFAFGRERAAAVRPIGLAASVQALLAAERGA